MPVTQPQEYDVFRLITPIYDMDTYICMGNVFTKQAEYKYIIP